MIFNIPSSPNHSVILIQTTSLPQMRQQWSNPHSQPDLQHPELSCHSNLCSFLCCFTQPLIPPVSLTMEM